MGIGVFDMVVIVVVVGCLTGVLNSYFKSKAQSGDNGPLRAELEGVKAQLAAAAQEVEKLNNRVRVLEKLATDDDRRLASEIERLNQVSPGA